MVIKLQVILSKLVVNIQNRKVMFLCLGLMEIFVNIKYIHLFHLEKKVLHILAISII